MQSENLGIYSFKTNSQNHKTELGWLIFGR